MERRKLIKFGKSAFCLTLPHAWVMKNKLKKGDMLIISESTKNSLEILPSSETPDEKTEIALDIEGKTVIEIVQLLRASYLNGYSLIVLTGDNSGKIAAIRLCVHELIASEIMDVSSEKIVIHVFWEISSISLDSIINRIGHTMAAIVDETIGLLDAKDEFNDIIHKELEIRRQVLFARRAMRHAFTHAAVAQKFNFSPLQLHYVSNITHYLELISGYVLELGRIIEDSVLSKTMDSKSKRELKAILRNMAVDTKVIISQYNNRETTGSIINLIKQRADDVERFCKKDVRPWRVSMCWYLKRIFVRINELQFNLICMENAPK